MPGEGPFEVRRPGWPKGSQLWIADLGNGLAGQEIDAKVGLARRQGTQEQSNRPPPVDVVVARGECTRGAVGH